MKSSSYQPEIDGLRAVAVVGVLLFHLDIAAFSGGYVGVDIFFVISGYLITNQIVTSAIRGNFTFTTFFIKRFRRIVPSLVAVLLVCTVLAYFILLPFDFERYSKALLSSLFSVSNIFFWTEAGYFDTAAKLKPLLHTWSLSVEMQFYLFWPVLVLLAFKLFRHYYVAAFIAAGVISALATVIVTHSSPSAAFFLTPMRVFEFVVGASLIHVANKQTSNNPVIANVAVVAGFTAIAYGFFTLDGSVSWWGLSNLIPCLGTALLIVYRNAVLSNFLLGSRAVVYIGQISYSLYLVHWPVIVFYIHVRFTDAISLKAIVLLVPVIFVLTLLLYYTVEKPLRYSKRRDGKFIDARMAACVLLLGGMAATGIYAATHEGLASRYPADVVRAVGNLADKRLVRRQHFDFDSPVSSQLFDQGASSKVLVVGDSHAVDLFNALHIPFQHDPTVSVRQLYFDDSCFYVLAQDNTSDDQLSHNKCLNTLATLKNSQQLAEATSVIISTRWKMDSISYLPLLKDLITQHSSASLAITGRIAEFKHVPTFVFKNGLDNNPEQNLFARRNASLDDINDLLKAASNDLDVPYFDKFEYACDRSSKECDVLDGNGDVLYLDYGHWSYEGAAYLGKKLLDNPVFNALVHSTGGAITR